MNAPKGQLLELTSTRFLAALAVLLGHFGEFGLPTGIVNSVAGGFGVSFFFVLSGFILTYRYWDDFAPGVAGVSFTRYFVARIARVYPSYAMALVLITLVYALMNVRSPGSIEYPANTLSSWLVNLFALQTFARTYATQQYWNAPAWSISTEFGFYVLFPFILAAIARFARSPRRLLVVLAITVAYAAAMQAMALVLVFRLGWNEPFWLDLIASRNIFWRLPEFLCGMVAARLLYGGHLPWLALARARNALLLVCLAITIVINTAPWPSDAQAVLIVRQFRLEVGYMLPFAGIVLALAAGPTLVSPLFRRPLAVFLGDTSYALYIYHWIPWMVLSRAVADGAQVSTGLVTGVIVLTILFAAASYLLYERPARIWLRRFAPKRPH